MTLAAPAVGFSLGWYAARSGYTARLHFFAAPGASLCGRAGAPVPVDPDAAPGRCWTCRCKAAHAREKQREAVEREAKRAARVLAFGPRVERVGRCRHGFTVATAINGRWACCLCEEHGDADGQPD